MNLQRPGVWCVALLLTGLAGTAGAAVTSAADQSKALVDGYYYGFLYGAIAALLLYNLLLGIILQSLPYVFYALCTGAFLLANMSYTGHGLAGFWPDDPVWQPWASPVWMTLYALGGFLFAGSFLQLRQILPRANYYLLGLCALMVLAQALSLLAQRQDYAVWVGFSNVTIFSVGMIVLGVLAQRYGQPSARYFLGAIVIGASGAGITCFTVLGLLSYSWPAYHAVEIGMMLAAMLLSLALAARLRGLEQGKLQAEKLALIDPLTQLSNQRGFYQRVAPVWQAALRNGRDMSVILIDVDRFQLINDTYGHRAGDEVLKALARVLLEHSRSADLAVRWDGEEFLIFLPDTGLTEALRVAERYRQVVTEQRFEVGAEAPVQLTASFGVATKQRQQEQLSDMISLAEHNLFCARQRGRDRVYPAPDDLARAVPPAVSPGH